MRIVQRLMRSQGDEEIQLASSLSERLPQTANDSAQRTRPRMVRYYNQYPLAVRIDLTGGGFNNLSDLLIAKASVTLSCTDYGHVTDTPERHGSSTAILPNNSP
jgi:hypothetical protein